MSWKERWKQLVRKVRLRSEVESALLLRTAISGIWRIILTEMRRVLPFGTAHGNPSTTGVFTGNISLMICMSMKRSWLIMADGLMKAHTAMSGCLMYTALPGVLIITVDGYGIP